MSGVNANWHNAARNGFRADLYNDHSGTFPDLRFNPDGNASGNPNIPPFFVDPFLTFTCGVNTTGLIHTKSFPSFFRSGDLVFNLRYPARQGTLVINTPQPVEIQVTAPFRPFVTLSHSAGHFWQSSDGSGVLMADVTADKTGPLTLEVTSVDPYQYGEFVVRVACNGSGPLILSSGAFPGASFVLLICDCNAAPFVHVGDLVYFYDVSRVTPRLLGSVPVTIFPAGLATITQNPFPVGTYRWQARYLNINDFDHISNNLDQVFNVPTWHCPIGNAHANLVLAAHGQPPANVNLFEDNFFFRLDGSIVYIQEVLGINSSGQFLARAQVTAFGGYCQLQYFYRDAALGLTNIALYEAFRDEAVGDYTLLDDTPWGGAPPMVTFGP